MGKTYRHEKPWGRRSPSKFKKRKKRGETQNPLDTERNQQEDYYDELESEAYEEEYNERRRKKGSNNF